MFVCLEVIFVCLLRKMKSKMKKEERERTSRVIYLNMKNKTCSRLANTFDLLVAMANNCNSHLVQIKIVSWTCSFFYIFCFFCFSCKRSSNFEAMAIRHVRFAVILQFQNWLSKKTIENEQAKFELRSWLDVATFATFNCLIVLPSMHLPIHLLF